MTNNRITHWFAGVVWAVCAMAICSCGEKQAAPFFVTLGPDLNIHLPDTYHIEEKNTREDMDITVISSEPNQTITVVITAAGRIPFSRQVRQDRNNLKLRKEYRILMEKPTDIHGAQGYMFITTSVENGKRYKAKTVFFRSRKHLVYLTVKSPKDRFERAVADFTHMIHSLKQKKKGTV